MGSGRHQTPGRTPPHLRIRARVREVDRARSLADSHCMFLPPDTARHHSIHTDSRTRLPPPTVRTGRSQELVPSGTVPLSTCQSHKVSGSHSTPTTLTLGNCRWAHQLEELPRILVTSMPTKDPCGWKLYRPDCYSGPALNLGTRYLLACAEGPYKHSGSDTSLYPFVRTMSIMLATVSTEDCSRSCCRWIMLPGNSSDMVVATILYTVVAGAP